VGGQGPRAERESAVPHLRPENTAGVVRAYIEHGLDRQGTLQKLYYIGPQFRRERPQKGRYRQFYQIGAEIIGPPSAGSESPARDAEVLEMLATLLDDVGLRDWNLQLNSVGCAEDRARYNKALHEALQPVVHQMCADCQRRARPIRCACSTANIRRISRSSRSCRRSASISTSLAASISPRCGRCSMHWAFRIPSTNAWCAGWTTTRARRSSSRTAAWARRARCSAEGDTMGCPKSLDGPKAPGIGFAIGEDRLILALQSQGEQPSEKVQAFVAPLGAGMNGHALKLARELRRAGVSADLGDENFRLKKSFEAAEKAGAKYIVIVGENEVAADTFAVKNLATGEQVQVPRPNSSNTCENRYRSKLALSV
jgi:histidyl-tRNA synthetase